MRDTDDPSGRSGADTGARSEVDLSTGSRADPTASSPATCNADSPSHNGDLSALEMQELMHGSASPAH